MVLLIEINYLQIMEILLRNLCLIGLDNIVIENKPLIHRMFISPSKLEGCSLFLLEVEVLLLPAPNPPNSLLSSLSAA